MTSTGRQKIIINLLRSAGAKIIQIYNDRSFVPVLKTDGSPVTEADTASENIIKDPLADLTGDPVISEESAGNIRSEDLQYERFWLLDPLDGTNEFIRGNGEFCICLALIENGVPAEGYIYSPVSGDLWYASRGLGAFRESAGITESLPLISQKGSYRILLSRSNHGKAESEWLEKISLMADTETITRGSAIKFGMIAEGTGDLYMKKGRIFGWDVAAGAAILKESGGGVFDLEGKNELIFRPDANPLPYFLACGHRIEDPSKFIF